MMDNTLNCQSFGASFSILTWAFSVTFEKSTSNARILSTILSASNWNRESNWNYEFVCAHERTM